MVKPYESPTKDYVLRVGDVVELVGRAPVKHTDGSLVWRARLYNDNFEFIDGLVPIDVLHVEEEDSPSDLELKKRQLLQAILDTEEEFLTKSSYVVQNYIRPVESAASDIPRLIVNAKHIIFGNFKQIYEFHHGVLKEGIEFSLKEPILFGKIFLRLERDFDRHALYFRDEPTAQAFLSNNDESLRFFAVSTQFNDSFFLLIRIYTCVYIQRQLKEVKLHSFTVILSET